MFAFSTDGFNYRELKDYVEAVRQQLLKVPNVAKVDLFGVQDEKIYIEISHRKLAQLGSTFRQLVSADRRTERGRRRRRAGAADRQPAGAHHR